MNPVQLVEIEKIIPIFKDGQPANSIEVVRIKDCEFNIISGKGLYNIGDKAMYIQPDYCLPNNKMFYEYFYPGGDEKKCKLGGHGRIKAIKFNFNFEGQSDPIYSNGILVPYTELKDIDLTLCGDELMKKVNVIKYSAEDYCGNDGPKKGMEEGDKPYFLYTTDEERCENLKGHICKCYENGEILGMSIKLDGSSTTSYLKKTNDEIFKGICSRTKEKKLNQIYIASYKDSEGNEFTPYLNPETKIRGWFNLYVDKFYTTEEIKTLGFEEIQIERRDAWVDTCKKYNIIEKLSEYCEKYNYQLALRGELIGQGIQQKKHNWDCINERQIIWFGVDSLESGVAVRNHYRCEHNLKKVCEELELPYTEEILEGVFSYDEIIAICNKYFKDIKENTGQIIEGIVIRSKYSNNLSCKYLNPEYDALSELPTA